MPGFDGTGPMGLGPMTGGGRGFCNPAFGASGFAGGAGSIYSRPYGWGSPYASGMGYVPYSPSGKIPSVSYIPFGWDRGMGWGLGRGRGRGWGRGWW